MNSPTSQNHTSDMALRHWTILAKTAPKVAVSYVTRRVAGCSCVLLEFTSNSADFSDTGCPANDSTGHKRVDLE
jgi:hypothetical protein